MTALTWDDTGKRQYEMGTDHGVLYPMTDGGVYENGVAWNGLTSVSESPEGAEANDMYADNIKYASLRSAETFGGDPQVSLNIGGRRHGSGITLSETAKSLRSNQFQISSGNSHPNAAGNRWRYTALQEFMRRL